MMLDILLSLLTVVLLGVGCGLGVFLGAWLMFHDTVVWPAKRPKVTPMGRIVKRNR